MATFPSKQLDQFTVRFPDGLRDRIKAAAAANNRSMNAEIVATLEEKYPAPPASDAVAVLLGFLDYVAGKNPPTEVEGAVEGIRQHIEAASPSEARRIADAFLRQLVEDLDSRPSDD